MRYVNVYEVGLAYGGPEEGGWWFEVGTPVLTRQVTTLRKARRVAERLRKRFPNTGASSNVLGGEDYRIFIEDQPGTPYPEVYPHYE